MREKALQRLGITLPIIQAPMAGTATPELAAAVSGAGALGSLGLATSSLEAAQSAIARTKSLTDAPFNVNFFCHQTASADPARERVWLTYLAPLFKEFGATPPTALHDPFSSLRDHPAMVDMLVQERPPIVSFHFGLPSADAIQRLKGAGIILMATATTLGEAQRIEESGLDFIVAQGVEAGGHRGVFDPHDQDIGLSTAVLVSLLREQVRLPVIAAGGIMTGRGIRAMLKLGASAAQMGTAFILCPESAADQAYRNALGSARALHTRITATISGRPARGLVNRAHTEIDTPGRPILPDYPICYVAIKALQKAAREHGCHEFASHWAGQGAPLARAMPAADLVAALAAEFEAAAAMD
ncbi:MAG: nitronate monooxygenase [Castellaniella sp.]